MESGIALSNPFTNANGNTDYYCPAVNTPSPFETDSQINDAVTAFQANGDGCNASPYDTWGKLVGTAYVARDIVAMAGALSDDKLVRYIGVLSFNFTFAQLIHPKVILGVHCWASLQLPCSLSSVIESLWMVTSVPSTITTESWWIYRY